MAPGRAAKPRHLPTLFVPAVTKTITTTSPAEMGLGHTKARPWHTPSVAARGLLFHSVLFLSALHFTAAVIHVQQCAALRHD